MEDQPGMYCFGFPGDEGQPPLVVVWDEGVFNEGTSATSSIENVLQYLRSKWSGVIAVEQALVIQRDSGEDLHHAVPDWSGPVTAAFGRGPRMSWQPVRWPGLEPSGRDAFVAMFGDRAKLVLEFIDEVNPELE